MTVGLTEQKQGSSHNATYSVHVRMLRDGHAMLYSEALATSYASSKPWRSQLCCERRQWL